MGNLRKSSTSLDASLDLLPLFFLIVLHCNTLSSGSEIY